METTTQTRRPSDAELGALMSRMTGDEKHEPAAHSTLEVLRVLYSDVLTIDPRRPDDPDRDRFLLSKGHGPMAYYATLAAHAFIDPDLLDGFASFDSPLGTHPDARLLPGVEIGSGSLGHGLGMAVGMAIGLRLRGRLRPRVFCLLGDGELDEGSNHEAVSVAGRLALASLTAIVVDNASSSLGWEGGIERRFVLEGWEGMRVDGRDPPALTAALQRRGERPRVVVAVIGAHRA